MPNQPFFTIVIPTLNEEKYLPSLLSDLAKQTFTDFEIIHVDGNSEDKTVKKAREYKEVLSIQSKVVKKRNVAFQRNLGARYRKGKWVIFMDADNRLPKYFLQGIKYQLDKHPAVDIFSCCVEVENDGLLKKSIQKSLNYFLEFYFLIGKVVAFGAMIGVRSEILTNHHFDETQKIYEDALFAQSVVNSGYTFLLLKEPAFNCSLRRLKKEGFLRTAKMVSKAHLQFLQGKGFNKDDGGYVMEGGGYYDVLPPLPLSKLRQFIETAPEKQLNKAKKLLKDLQKIQW